MPSSHTKRGHTCRTTGLTCFITQARIAGMATSAPARAATSRVPMMTSTEGRVTVPADPVNTVTSTRRITVTTKRDTIVRDTVATASGPGTFCLER